MSDTANSYQQIDAPIVSEKPKKKKVSIWLNILLFITTFVTTTQAGILWLGRDPYDVTNFSLGLPYSISILLILTFHEFGHYFAARFHKVEVTLPFYIPFPIFTISFGTMGAVIRMREHLKSRKALFDIGIAGPIAGFVMTLAILIYGLTHLPPVEYLYQIHPDYAFNGIPVKGEFMLSPTLLYALLAKIFVAQDAFLPPMSEIYHYPYLCAGWFGMIITALNLLPVGQLDGGHITYATLGMKHKFVARIFFGIVCLMGLVGVAAYIFDENPLSGLTMWIVWAILMVTVIKIDHPPIYDNEPIGTKRKFWAVFALLMFIGCFTPLPILSY